jgi:hypothetical protein
MDGILTDYQFYFIFGSYAVFFIFLSSLTLFYILQFRYYTKRVAILATNPVYDQRKHPNE